MANDKLHRAKTQKNDEFYTQYSDIQKEVNAYLEYNPNVFKDKVILLPCDDPEWSNFTKFFAQNFERFGLKKLISTSYAHESKGFKGTYQLSLFESESPKFDIEKTKTHGKLFILDKDENKSGKIDINDLEWEYLEGDGDFRSDEVKKLRDEADIIITNPPFSLFREFIDWILEAQKKFLTIGNLNAITYKEIFPLLKDNSIWLGATTFNGGATFFMGSPELYDPKKMSNPKHAYIKDNVLYWRVNGVRWFTNLDHGRRHQPLQLMTMEDNIKYSKHKEVRGKEYEKYLNYEVLEVPFTDAIPSNYTGHMGVPVSFMEKYNPEQFIIVGCADANIVPEGWKGMPEHFVKLYYEQGNTGAYKEGNRLACYINKDGLAIVPYKRIIIKPNMEEKDEDNIEN